MFFYNFGPRPQQNFNEANGNSSTRDRHKEEGTGEGSEGGERSYLAATPLHSKNMAKNPELFQSYLTKRGEEAGSDGKVA